MRYKRRLGLWLPDEKPPFGRIQLNQRHPLARGLAGCWLFNEGGGNKVFDLSGNQNHGSLENGVNWARSKKGPALDFDGTDDYVNITHNPSLDVLSYNWMIEAWVKINQLETLGIVEISGGAIRYALQIFSGQFVMTEATTDVGTGKYGAGTVDPNKWYHIIGRRNGPISAEMYINGVHHEVLTSVGIWLKEGDVFGKSSYNQLNGEIALVRIWNRILNGAEARQLYRNPFCMLSKKKQLRQSKI